MSQDTLSQTLPDSAPPAAAPLDPVTRFGAAVIRQRRWILLFTALAVALMAGGLAFLKLTTDNRVFFGPRNPQLLAFQAFEHTYAESNYVLVAFVPQDGNAFDRDTLAAVETFTKAAWRLPYATRVESLTNFPYSHARGDELVVEDLVANARDLSDQDLRRVREYALSEPLLRGLLTTADGGAVAALVNFLMPDRADDQAIREIHGALRDLAQEIQAGQPGLAIHLSGDLILGAAVGEATADDVGLLMPLMFGVILVLVGALLRSAYATLAVLALLLLAVLTAMGLAGWLGYVLNPGSAIAPTIIVTIAVADSVHLFASLRQAMGRGLDKRSAVLEALRVNFKPVFLTSFTTALGFLTMNFSDSPPFNDLGNLVALGVAAAWVYTIVVLPALLMVLPIRVPPLPAAGPTWPERLADWVIRRQQALLWGGGLLFLVLAAGMARIQLSDDWVEYFDERYAFRRDTDAIIAKLTGIERLEFSLPAPGGDIADPDYLRTVDAFAGWLRAYPGVTNVQSLTDIVKRLNRNLHGDDPAYTRLPDDPGLTAQYLLLYELSLPPGQDINDRIDIAKTQTRVSATGDFDTAALRRLEAEANAWLQANAAPAMVTDATGMSIIFAHLSERNIHSMLSASLLALVLISGLLILALGSLRLGLISLVPNLLPAAMAFGFWGWTFRELGMAVSVVGAMTLGIIVDDTIHFLSKYQHARRRGLEPAAAVRYAFTTVGRALLTTSVALSAGFGVLACSGFQVNWAMGLLSALTIVLALAADLLLLPALLLRLDRPAPSRHPALVGLLLGLALVPVAALADPGLDIAREADRRDSGFGDYRADLTMRLRDRHQRESTRELRLAVLEQAGDGDKSLIVFDRPPDIHGTALLTYSHPNGDDDQWLYLPALKRVKRISAANRAGAFVGSEFAYEDLTSQEVEEYTYRWLQDEACAELTCFVVERHPLNPASGYTRSRVWYDRQHYRVQRIDFYDRKDSLQKTLLLEDYHLYQDRFWRAHRMRMDNHQTGKSTELQWRNIRFGTGLGERDFDQNSLKRAR